MTTQASFLPTTIIRPGLLVSLSVRLNGGVTYEKTELEATHQVGPDSAATKARWETTRTITDAEEYERAGKLRSKARAMIARTCCDSALGLLCPVGREADLMQAIEDARREAAGFNTTAMYSRVEVYVLLGRVSDNDVEAVRAISAEVRDLLEAMDAGVKAADPERIREAANRARELSGMLSDDVQAKVGKAIDEVRTIARDLVRATKAGETAASVIDTVKLARLDAARFAVLDIAGGVQDVRDVAAPAAPAIDLPVIDLSDLPPIVMPAEQPVPAIEL